MGNYDQDPRVTPWGNGYSVADDGRDFRILNNGEPLGWGVYEGPNLDLLPVAGGGWFLGFEGPDDAIGALIGDPQ